MVQCVPLVADKKAVGIVQLGYIGEIPSPPTKYLGTLLAVAERASQVIQQVSTNLQNQQMAQSRLSLPTQGLRRDIADIHPAVQTPAQEADKADDRPLLEIRCFGSFELYLRGELIIPEMFHRRGALTLLKILLLQEGHQISRDALVEFLWPEADPEAGTNRLYVLVHALRQIVEPSEHGQHWNFICSDGDRYYFNSDGSCWLDVKEFHGYIDLGERLERVGDIEAAMDAYEAAVSLYRGDLLEEELAAEWCWEEREHLREICLVALSKLATYYVEHDFADRSIDCYRHALRIDSMREENHRGLMRALWAARRRDEALRQYDVCREILLRELEVSPLPETNKLYLLIRDDSTS